MSDWNEETARRLYNYVTEIKVTAHIAAQWQRRLAADIRAALEEIRRLAAENKDLKRLYQEAGENWQAAGERAEATEARLSKVQLALAKAAQEIHCAGPVDHRIRVLRREHADLVAKLEARLREAVTRWEDSDAEAKEWRRKAEQRSEQIDTLKRAVEVEQARLREVEADRDHLRGLMTARSILKDEVEAAQAESKALREAMAANEGYEDELEAQVAQLKAEAKR